MCATDDDTRSAAPSGASRWAARLSCAPRSGPVVGTAPWASCPGGASACAASASGSEPEGEAQRGRRRPRRRPLRRARPEPHRLVAAPGSMPSGEGRGGVAGGPPVAQAERAGVRAREPEIVGARHDDQDGPEHVEVLRDADLAAGPARATAVARSGMPITSPASQSAPASCRGPRRAPRRSGGEAPSARSRRSRSLRSTDRVPAGSRATRASPHRARSWRRSPECRCAAIAGPSEARLRSAATGSVVVRARASSRPFGEPGWASSAIRQPPALRGGARSCIRAECSRRGDRSRVPPDRLAHAPARFFGSRASRPRCSS